MKSRHSQRLYRVWVVELSVILGGCGVIVHGRGSVLTYEVALLLVDLQATGLFTFVLQLEYALKSKESPWHVL